MTSAQTQTRAEPSPRGLRTSGGAFGDAVKSTARRPAEAHRSEGRGYRYRTHSRSRSVQLSLLVVFLVLASQDAVRKSTGAPSWVLLLQDLPIALAYLAGIRLRGRRSVPSGAYIVAAALALWVWLEMTTPDSSAATALLGFHTYLWYLPLVLVGANHLATPKATQRAYTFLVMAGTGVGLLAVLGAALGDAAPAILRPIAENTARRSYGNTAAIYLSPSIFATGEKAANFLILCLSASQLPTARLQFRPTFQRLAVLSMFAGLVATQRRTAILVGAGVFAAAFWARRRYRLSKPAKRLDQKLMVTLAVAGLVTMVAVSPAALSRSTSAFGSFLLDLANARGVAQNAVLIPDQPWAIEGQGAGTATLGLDKSGQDLAGLTRAEGIVAKVWLELGLVGSVLFLWLISTLVLPLAHAAPRSSNPVAVWTIYALGVLLLSLKGHQVFDNPQVQIPFWLAVGAAYGHLRTSRTDRRSPAKVASQIWCKSRLTQAPHSDVAQPV